MTKNRFLKTIFDKAWTPFWKTFLQLEQLFNAKLLCVFQNYCSPTRVTRLKFVPNMADPISTKDSDSRLNNTSELWLSVSYVFHFSFILHFKKRKIVMMKIYGFVVTFRPVSSDHGHFEIFLRVIQSYIWTSRYKQMHFIYISMISSIFPELFQIYLDIYHYSIKSKYLFINNYYHNIHPNGVAKVV